MYKTHRHIPYRQGDEQQLIVDGDAVPLPSYEHIISSSPSTIPPQVPRIPHWWVEGILLLLNTTLHPPWIVSYHHINEHYD